MRETMQVRSGSVREFAHGLVRVADGKEDLARLPVSYTHLTLPTT